MADPTSYERDYSFSDYQSNNPSQPLPGPRVDNELENIEQAISGLVGAVKDVRRSDGKLVNGIVTMDSLSPIVKAGVGQGAVETLEQAHEAAQAAAQSASAAASSAGAAAGSAGTAATSAGQAMGFRNAAQNARDDAITAKTGADTARDFAAQWASAPGGQTVDDGLNPPEYSAYHYAQVALGAAEGNLPDGAVTTSKIAGEAVTTPKIAGEAVTEAKLAPEVVEKLNRGAPIYDTVDSMPAVTVPTEINAVRVDGRSSVGDGEGGLYIDVDNGAADKFTSQGGRTWYRAPDVGRTRISHFERSIPLNVREFGAVGSDNELALVDETAALQAAIDAAIAGKRSLIFNDTNYLVSSSLRYGASGVFSAVVSARAGGQSVIHGTSNLAKTASGSIMTFWRNAYDVTGIALSAEVFPNREYITVANVAGLQAGMLLSLSSDQLWPYDPRDMWMRGEVHVISRVDSVTKRVYFEEPTSDYYSPAWALSIVAWWPSFAEVSGLSTKYPKIATADVTSTSGFTFRGLSRMALDNLSAERCGSSGLAISQCAHPVIDNFKARSIGRQANYGYGIMLQSSIGSIVRGLNTHGCRRGIDLGSLSGDRSAPNRDTLVSDFRCYGGGTEADGVTPYAFGTGAGSPSFGVGMHGPAERSTFSNGIISGVYQGVTVRGRDTTVKNVEFYGNIDAAIQATYGMGLDVRGCTYYAGDVPSKGTNSGDAATRLRTFVRFGHGATGGEFRTGANLTVIADNAVFGVAASFVEFVARGTYDRLYIANNQITVNPDDTATANIFDAPNGSVNIVRSSLGPNRFIHSGNGSSNFSNGMTIGVRESSDSPVQLSSSLWTVVLANNEFARIRLPNHMPAGDLAVRITSSEDGGGTSDGDLTIRSDGTSKSMGAIGTDLNVASVALSGSTGTSGKTTISWNNGMLYVENRRGGNRTYRISIA